MWVVFRRVSNLIVAEAWKELLEDAGIPAQIRWEHPGSREDALATCNVMVPNSRLHVAEQVASRS